MSAIRRNADVAILSQAAAVGFSLVFENMGGAVFYVAETK
jgi:hypothetical protein